MNHKTFKLTVEVTDEYGLFHKAAVLIYDEKTKGVLTAHASNKLKESVDRAYEILEKMREKL